MGGLPMRVNFHMKAELRSRKCAPTGSRRPGLGLVFQLLDSEETEALQMLAVEDPDGTQDAIGQFSEDDLRSQRQSGRRGSES